MSFLVMNPMGEACADAVQVLAACLLCGGYDTRLCYRTLPCAMDAPTAPALDRAGLGWIKITKLAESQGVPGSLSSCTWYDTVVFPLFQHKSMPRIFQPLSLT